jgi:hypothetical protein
MRRSRSVIAIALAIAALGLAACGGGDDDDQTTSPAPTEVPAGDAAAPPQGALPPEVLGCFSERGYEIESPGEIHSAPQQVVQACFGALHQGGGGP